MKSAEVQSSPIYRNRALKHLLPSEPHAVLGSKYMYVMAKPAQFAKLSDPPKVFLKRLWTDGVAFQPKAPTEVFKVSYKLS